MAAMQIPNNNPGGNREDSTAGLNKSGGVVHGPNQSDPGARANGTAALGGSTGVISPPAAKHFAVGHSSQPSGS